MRVLLTGSAGFIGRHLHRELDRRGHTVTTCDLRAAHIGDALEFFRRDRTRYELAIHCAAIVGGRASIDGSPLGVATNLALDSWFMRWLAATKTPRAVYYSSSAAYPVELQGEGSGHRLTEDDIDLARPGRPDATYGLAKLTGEQLVPYAEAEGCRVHVLRPMSGYGPSQSPAYPFPAFIGRALRREDPYEIWGSGRQVRDWIHIDDVVAATLAAVDQDVTGPVNLGTGRATSFDELAEIVCREAGYRPQLKHRLDAPDGVQYRVADPARLLGFYRPRVSLEEGVRRALEVGRG
ncbi:NAD(P)-dependent oxidoreductase [Kitasatospora atroaurantiaca]|uniref:Nucleoside-diphosphate-sugar epimerase n=1 Tax=Kitasatospora atroaurantiaca TaxID=285545 RepID=A0A561ENF5_9ACTN|nr:NAD-dependent epimerase/dehydratase family protein [Kitasatospora atroaurantiaca]TWE17153.1 nucleoside-diphosphate-sugar epimerase [Kitasatospora atroaurantiaca]